MRTGLFLSSALALSLSITHPAAGADLHGGAMPPPQAQGASFTGVVLETTNASRYTYVRIDTGTEKIWAAGPVVAVKAGDRVSFGAGMPNKNFYSPTLKKNFDELYFADAILPAGGSPVMPMGHAAMMAGAGKATNTVVEPIQKAEGGKTVAEIWSGKATLSGKQVTVRAKVVKVAPNIMGKTFLHLRDGTGTEGSNDLTVTTTNEVVRVGMVVLASGTVVTDKDFGSGYKYAVILEEATVTVK